MLKCSLFKADEVKEKGPKEYQALFSDSHTFFVVVVNNSNSMNTDFPNYTKFRNC